MQKFISAIRKVKGKIVAKVKIDSWLWKLLRSIYRLLPSSSEEDTNPIKDILATFSQNTKKVFFVQIGSCDGVTNDPIHPFILKDDWSGIMVEPVDYLYNRLKENYQGNENLTFENAAIAENNEVRDFWYVEELENLDSNIPSWYNQLGSFNSNYISDHLPDLQNHIVKKPVNCITLESLIHKYNISKIDLLHTDVEGYDFKIIKQIDFSKFTPKIILYEHKLLSDSDRSQCREYLKSKGYKLYEAESDTVAFIGKYD